MSFFLLFVSMQVQGPDTQPWLLCQPLQFQKFYPCAVAGAMVAGSGKQS